MADPCGAQAYTACAAGRSLTMATNQHAVSRYAPRITPEVTGDSGFRPSSRLLPRVDMVRDERRIFVTLEDDPPSSIRIHS